jgi:hypothetical protein
MADGWIDCSLDTVTDNESTILFSGMHPSGVQNQGQTLDSSEHLLNGTVGSCQSDNGTLYSANDAVPTFVDIV